MNRGAYRFQFEPSVPLAEAEMTLQLSIIAVGGLLGESRVRTDGAYHLDEPGRVINVDGSTRVGVALARVFAGLLVREFGDESFRVRRVVSPTSPADRKPRRVA